MNPLAVAVMDADVEALEWLIQLFDGKGLSGAIRRHGTLWIAAEQGKIESLTCLRVNGCPWNKWTCETATRGRSPGICCSGRVRTGARGTRTRAPTRRMKVTWICCGGRVRTGARGTREDVRGRGGGEGTWRCCSGRVRTGARGTR